MSRAPSLLAHALRYRPSKGSAFGFVKIWWPGLPSWKRHLGVNRKAGWKRLVWELHSATGFWSVLFILVLSLTGIYYTWPDASQSHIQNQSLDSESAAASRRVGRDGPAPDHWLTGHDR